jgi:hypothetical protein
MRAKVAVLAAAAVAMLGACSALTGLDAISEQACAPACANVEPDGALPQETDASYGSGDGTVPVDTGEPRGDDGEAPRDASTGGDVVAPARDSGADDDSAVSPTNSDSGAMDSGSNMTRDSGGIDSAPDGRVPDSGTEDTGTQDTGTGGSGDSGDSDSGSMGEADSGSDDDADCGPVDTITSCGACGKECIASGGVATSCNAGDCVYACSADYLDCNAATPPNTDGCECFAPGPGVESCCGTTCPIAHSWDLQATLGESRYYSCDPLGTMNETLALEACEAALGSPAECRTTTCYNPDDELSTGVVCGTSGSICDCWAYANTAQMPAQAAHFAKSSGGHCLCPVAATSPTWD